MHLVDIYPFLSSRKTHFRPSSYEEFGLGPWTVYDIPHYHDDDYGQHLTYISPCQVDDCSVIYVVPPYLFFLHGS